MQVCKQGIEEEERKAPFRERKNIA